MSENEFDPDGVLPVPDQPLEVEERPEPMGTLLTPPETPNIDNGPEDNNHE